MECPQIDLYEFLTEAELQHYYNAIKNELKITNAAHVKYATDEDLKHIGLSRPEIRRLRKFYEKHFPHGYLSKIKRLLQAPATIVKRDSSDGTSTLSNASLHSAAESPSAAHTANSPSKAPNNKHIIPADSITVNKQLGTGEFGIVQQGVWTNGTERIQVAIKCLCRERMQSNPMEFLKEAAIMHSIEHENIVRLYGVVLATDSLMLVTELAHLRSLLECLKDPGLRVSFLTIPTLCEFAMQICNGMSYLENKRLIHRDLAARNILVFSKDKVKISDFGLSRALGVGKDYYKTNFNVNLKLPIAWCAPECINYLRFTNASDVWAYGVCLWEMFSYGFQPWAALTGLQILEAIDAPNYQRLEQPDCCPQEYYTLMMKCWQDDPAKRPKFSEIYELLPDMKPEQLKAVVHCLEPKKDNLLYRQGDIITVLDRNTGTPFWKGVLTSGKTGFFNPSNTVAYLEGLPTANRDSFCRTTERISKRKLRTEMISKPQNDFKHTGHVGIDGDSFGDIAFLGNSQNYNHVPRQIVTPYKPSEDIEQTPLLLPPTPTSPDSLQTASGYFPEEGHGTSMNPTFISSTENTPKHFNTGNGGQPSFEFPGQQPHSKSFTNPFTHKGDDEVLVGGAFAMQNNNYGLDSHSFQGDIAAAQQWREAGKNGGSTEDQHEYHEISDDEITADKLDFGPSLLDEINSMFGSMSASVSVAPPKPSDFEHTNKKNEFTEISSKLVGKSASSGDTNGNKFGTSSKKKSAGTVKPISVKDERILNQAIEIANEISARSMNDLVSDQTSNTQSPKRKFSFRFPHLTSGGGSDKTSGSNGSPTAGGSSSANAAAQKSLSPYSKKKNFTEELESIPDLQIMSKKKPKIIYDTRTEHPDRAKKENESFKEVIVPIEAIETALLLLHSQEDSVLVTVFKNITEFARKQDENVVELRKLNLLDLLLAKKFYMTSEAIMIRRFAMYLACSMVESMSVLQDLEPKQTMSILNTCLEVYMQEVDDFCMEYLTVIINKCLDDPQVANEMLKQNEFLEKFFVIVAKTENPDILWQSFEAIHKMLLLLDAQSLQELSTLPLFPIDRVLCDLSNDYTEIRSAALKIIKDLVVDTSDSSAFADVGRCIFTLQQLTQLFCNHATTDHGSEAIEALATAMRTEKMAQLFFEHNLFDRIIQNVNEHLLDYSASVKCKVMWIFAENAKYEQFLQRLFNASVTDFLLDCLLQVDPPGPAPHVIAGLNRMMKHTAAANRIVQWYEAGVIERLVAIISQPGIDIRTREQAATLISNLLQFAFHDTAPLLLSEQIPQVLGKIFGQQPTDLSIDFMLSLLNIIEQLAQNEEYRAVLGESALLATNIALMLKNSFATAILVNNIFRCLCTLVDEEQIRTFLLSHHIAASMIRGLKSLSNLVKTSVTNFIMQTTRFPEMIHEYIEAGVLEVLIMHQKLAMCVSTWGPAIEAILSKSPSLKFCIRNHLGFTDSTAGNDFLVSKKKFDDFRIFQHILKADVSPMHPILVVNFERTVNPPELVIEVPIECFSVEERTGVTWCYCRKPGDSELPRILDNVNQELEKYGLLQNPAKISRGIDFDNLARRAKVIAEVVEAALSSDLKRLDLNTTEECCNNTVKCHFIDLARMLHCNFIPIGMVRTGCQFERAILFKALADQIGLPCTLQRAVDGRLLFNEVPLPAEMEHDTHCDKKTMQFMPWRMLRPTHIVDLMFNVGELYPIQSRQALQYLRLY
ncbi:uncharacterized protein LOC118742986 isoform X1 [Rhagoletis pomonella]|uniref:uncharacterized protein LOC118742986 isoform X1 n=1 Tax=Rhagoletis pomonella TaxID=28610 RepID=UPI0017873718|nr:uncharacterized protein LOC118742986 isoform X1 [Rhagoletis pomonella]